VPNPTRLSFRIVASVDANRLKREIWMWNAQGGTFELVYSRPATLTDDAARIDLGPNFARFLDPAGNLKARVKWSSFSPKAARTWQVSVNQAVWAAGL
jgi:hypothetical protein